MQAKPIKTIQFDNNIKMDLYDRSKKLAGDRWLVSLFARMEIPVEETLLKNSSQADIDIEDLKKILGDQVVFEQKRERIFIDEQEKDNLLATIMDEFLKNTLPYLSRSEFPGKYILKEYRDAKKANKVNYNR